MDNRRVCAFIDADAIRHNFDEMRKNLRPGTKICAVVKTDGYGHGAEHIAKVTAGMEDIWGYAVATAQEALDLRSCQVRKPVLILGYVFPEDYEPLIEQEIRLTVFSTETAEELARTARRMNREAYIHLAVDTGMSRIGFMPTPEAAAQAAAICRMDGLRTEGLFTHFSRADEKDKSHTLEAFDIFKAFYESLKKQGIRIPLVHCSNSAGILELPQTQLDMVRAGITIYGIYPSDEMDRDRNILSPVMSIKSHIAYLKTVPAGTPVSYGGSYVTSRTTRIATIPVGYGDGYPRSLSSRGRVLIGGKYANIIGRVCMDQFMVDVTDIPAALHQKVTLLGRDGELEVTADELGALSGRFPYELVCDIGKRVPRILTNM